MGTFWQLLHSGNKHHHLKVNLQEAIEMKIMILRGGILRQPVLAGTDPPPVDLGEVKMQGDKHSETCLCHQSVFIRIGGLSQWTECFQSRQASNCHRPGVLSHLPAFLSFSLYFITYWLTSWALQVHKSPSFERFLAFCVCVEWEYYWKRLILESQPQRTSSSFGFICKSEASKDGVIMMKQI